MEDYNNSRKRPMGYDGSASDAKRSNFSGGDEPLLKLTVPGYVAGALLGKGGTLLNELKEQHGGNIRISVPKEFYPGTVERVVVLTGTVEQIKNLSKYIMEKMENPGRDGSMRQVSVDENRARKMKIVLTNNAAGLLIGRGGSTIKAIQTESKAYLSIVGSNEGAVPGERVLTVHSDSLDDRVEAIRRILDVIAEDTSNMANTQLRYGGSNPSSGPMSNVTSMLNKDNRMDGGSLERQLIDSIAEKLGVFKPGALNQGGSVASGERRLKPKVEVTVEIPDVLVGGVLGKQGSVVKELSLRSGGARFKFSEKGTQENNNRKLTIMGNMDQAYKGFNLVNERVEILENEHKQQQEFKQQHPPDRQNPMHQFQQPFQQPPNNYQQSFQDPYQQPFHNQQQHNQHNQHNHNNIPYQAWNQYKSY